MAKVSQETAKAVTTASEITGMDSDAIYQNLHTEAQELFQLRKDIKRMQEREKRIKEKLKKFLPRDGVLDFADLTVAKEERHRTDLDTNALKEALGERLEAMYRPSHYDSIVVKKK